MRGDAERWKRLDEAEVRRQKQKNMRKKWLEMMK